MSYSSPQVLQLEAIRDWMATLDVWSEWVGSDVAATLKARVVWPLSATQTLPACVLALGSQQTVNFSGAAGGANFQPAGIINLFIYAEDTAPSNAQTGYSDFADLFFRLISEMADKAHEAPVFFNTFSMAPAGAVAPGARVAVAVDMESSGSQEAVTPAC